MTLPGMNMSILPVRPVEARLALRWYRYKPRELLVVTQLGRRTAFRLPLLNAVKPPEFELGEIVANGSAVKNSRRGHNHKAYKPTHLMPAKASALDHFPTAGGCE